jgi:hypothetical protein
LVLEGIPEKEAYPIAKKKNPNHWPKPMGGFLSLISGTSLQIFDHLASLPYAQIIKAILIPTLDLV